MSQENVEIAKRGIDALNRLDVDAYAEIATADFELFPAMMGVVEGIGFVGREGIEQFFADLGDTWRKSN